jgi:hypothetical protein
MGQHMLQSGFGHLQLLPDLCQRNFNSQGSTATLLVLFAFMIYNLVTFWLLFNTLKYLPKGSFSP